MANGYIGKISALVTASTADLSRKLQGGTRDVNRFANSVNAQIAGASSSARKSLEGIFTPLQRAQRAFSAGLALNLIDEAQVRRLQQTVSIAEQISKPLGAASRVFQGLSADVAAGLVPALLRAQDAAQRVNDEVGTTGGVTASSYRVAEQAIDRAAAAFERFRQAEQIIGSAPRGRELQFDDPQLFEALQRSANARRGAAAPGVASRVGGALGDAVREVTRFDELVAQAASRISGIRLAPQVDTSQLERAQGEYQDLLVQQRRAVEELNRLSVDPAQVERDADDAAFAAFVKSQQESLKLENQLAAAADQRAAAEEEVFQAYIRQQQAAKQLDALLADQDPAERVRQRAEAEAALRERREEELRAAKGQRTDIPTSRQGRARILDTLGGEIDVVDRKVRALPDALQSQLGPEVNKLTNEFRILGRDGVGFTAEQAEKLAAKTREITAALNARQARGKQFLEDFGGAGVAGLNLGIDERELRGAGGQIEFLQNKLSQFSAEARGPAVASLQRYREVVTKVFADGAQNTERGRAAIDRAAASVVRLTARLEGVKTGKLAAELQRVGDVARGVGSKGGLAFQQLVFAVDDFFSVTGGLDQRIRAAGNNISQLGFILGGTTGLILGVAASLAAQGVAAFIKWSGAAVEADDKAKALSETLKRQSDLVNELQNAFSTLGADLIEGVFSSAALSAQKLAEQIERIIKLQRDLREDRVASFDPEVQRERALQGALERSKGEKGFLGRPKSLEELTAIEARIAASREREQRAARRSVEDARGLRGQEGRIAEALTLPQTLRLLQARPGAAPTRELQAEARGIARQRAEEIAALPPAEREAAIRELREEVEDYLTSVRAEFNVGQSRIDDIAGTFDSILEQFRLAASEAADPLAESFAKEADALRGRLARAGETLEESIKEGIPGAAALRGGLDELGEVIRRGNKAIEDSVRLPPDQQRATRENAIAGVRDANRQLDARLKEVAAIDSTRRSLESFAAALDRVADQLVNTLAQEARAAADQARRDANRAQGRLEGGLGGRQEDVDRAQSRRAALEKEALAAELRAAQQRAASLRARNQFEGDAVAGRLGAEAQQLVAQRDAAQAVLDNPAALGAAKREAEAVLAVVNVQLQQIFERSGAAAAARKFADALDAAAASVSGRQEAIDRGRELLERPGERAGRDLRQDIESLRAAAGETTGINEIKLEKIDSFLAERDRLFEEAARNREQELGRPLGPNEAIVFGNERESREERDARLAPIREAAEAFNRLVEGRLRQEAPAIFGLADQVANAVLQGPSRAALEATDVSTVEGSRELNRLLRGDDSARDQNLVELQKQSVILEDMLEELRQGGAQVANN